MLANKVALVNQLDTRVRNFNRKGDYSWQFSCDICGDSRKDMRKARFYVGRRDGDLMCHCHNCGWSGSIISYFRLQHPDLSRQLVQEKFLDEAPNLFNPNDLFLKNLDSETLSHLFYISRFEDDREWVEFLKSKKMSLTKDNFTTLFQIRKDWYNH